MSEAQTWPAWSCQLINGMLSARTTREIMALRTQEICKVEARWTRVPDLRQVLMTTSSFTGIDEFALSEEKDLVEQGYNVAARLMNCEDHRSIVIPGKGYQTLNDTESVESVQT